MNNIFIKRRSERDLINEPLKVSDIKEIIAAGEHAPVAKGRYEDLLIQVYDGEKLEELKAEYTKLIGKNPFYDGSLFILISQKNEKDCLANQNAGCILENMLLEAASRDIGGVFLYSPVGIMEQFPSLKETLGIREGYTPLAGAVFGKIKEKTTREVNHCIETEFFLDTQRL